MLDLRTVRDNPEEVKSQLARRGGDFARVIDEILELDEKRRAGLQEAEKNKSVTNTLSAEVGQKKKAGEDASALMQEVKMLKARIKELDEATREHEAALHELLLAVPNTPHPSVPEGEDESANELVRVCGEKPAFDFTVKNHLELGEALDILDLKRAVKIAGSRFAVYKGDGALLLRAIIQFMLDVQTRENGYTELYPPFMVNADSMTGTGQLPKFEEDLFKLHDDPLYLIPTAEVPVTNYHRDEILENLPVRYAAYTPCFRREAGSYGKDTQGIIRQHQFDKVELVQFVEPENSYKELEGLLGHAESILQKLGLHYRVVVLCTGDLGFSSAKTFDIEVWLPSQDTYREISSCSNFTDYQARRAKIRHRDDHGKPELLHTLNGSGLAAGRLFVAILENCQQPDGTIQIPKPLQPYMNGKEVIGG